MKTALQRFSYLLVLPLLLATITATAQENSIVQISGKVKDQGTGEPIPGVSIQVKGTIAGTTTDNSGALC